VETGEVSDYQTLYAMGCELFEIADRLDSIGTGPAKDLASCLGILLLAIERGYIVECKESLINFAERCQLHPDALD
jgi:hypothetical protein